VVGGASLEEGVLYGCARRSFVCATLAVVSSVFDRIVPDRAAVWSARRRDVVPSSTSAGIALPAGVISGNRVHSVFSPRAVPDPRDRSDADYLRGSLVL